MINPHTPASQLTGRKARAVRDLVNAKGQTIWKGWAVKIYFAAGPDGELFVRGLARGTEMSFVKREDLTLIDDKPKGKK